MKATSQITPEQIEKIKAADLGNIVKKVKAGKTLSTAERKILDGYAGDDAPSDGEFVTTSRLATIFQVNRKSINQWRNEGREGVPEKKNGKEPLMEWRAWFASNPSAGHYDGKPRKDRESLLCEKLEVEIAIKRIQLAAEERSYLPAHEVRETIIRVVSAIRSEFTKLPSELPPRISGLAETAIQRVLRDEIYGVLDRLSDETIAIFEATEQQP